MVQSRREHRRKKRNPRLNKESWERCFFWVSFFRVVLVIFFVKRPHGYSPMQGYSQYHHQPLESVGKQYMRFCQRKASWFKIRKHVFDAPAHAIIQGSIFSGLSIHRNIPRFFMTRFMQNPHMCSHARAKTRWFQNLMTLCFQLIKDLVGALILIHTQIAF